eukprot:3387882-Pleurochrysis_carterae.AAC.1
MELRITPHATLAARWWWRWTPFAAKRTPTAFYYKRTSPGLPATPHSTQEEHTAEHRQKRYYAHDSVWTKSETEPANDTALNVDAPTQDQFDIPVQYRNARDVVKSLETKLNWKSKITGVMSAGMGMLAYVLRFGLGSGPNSTCTTLYLTLIATARTRGLGTRLN